MARLEVVSFSGEHLEDAGRLLAARHARQREVEPLLPPRFEDPGAAQEEVAEAWSREGASGTAAFRGGRLVGYLVAAPREGAAWGENVWVEPAGHAVEDAEDVRALYAAAAGIWVEGGRRAHYALVPATDAGLVDAWFRLGFGHQQAHGVREVPADIAVRAPEGLVIRARPARRTSRRCSRSTSPCPGTSGAPRSSPGGRCRPTTSCGRSGARRSQMTTRRS